jgi:hypothetical protein
MAKIGFGEVAERTETWKKEIGGIIFVFTKTRENERLFTYGCKRKFTHEGGITSDTSCGFQTDRDLDREEIESRAQFVGFTGGGVVQ